MNWKRCLIALACFALVAASTTARAVGIGAPEVTDAYATEDVGAWNYRNVPDLAISTDAKEGKHSLVGTYLFTRNIGLNSGKTAWNLTGWDKLCFWAKADEKNNNLLVMLSTKGYNNRRDAAVNLTKEWKYFELPLTENRFNKNVQGDADFALVRSIIFYNNQSTQDKKGMRIWIDGLKLTGRKTPVRPAPRKAQTHLDGSVNVLKLTAVDPFPHLDEASRGKHQLNPRYDLPPVAFNKQNAFKDALVNFDRIEEWTAVVRDANGYLCLSMDQTLRGTPNLKVEIIPTGKSPRITLVPPKPIEVTQAFDVVECLVYSGKSGGSIAFEFERKDGSTLGVGVDHGDTADDVNPKPVGEFWVLARTVLPAAIEPGAKLKAVVLTPRVSKRYKDPTYLFHVDQLRVQLFKDYISQPPPKFENVGKVVDNFPVTPEGACPRTLEAVKTAVKRVGDAYHFIYAAKDGEEVRYVYTPRTGTFADIKIQPKGLAAFQPAADSGPVFDFNGRSYDVPAGKGGTAELLRQDLRDNVLRVAWQYSSGEQSQTITYTFDMLGKTLRIDASSEQRHVAKWLFGEARGVKDARVIEVPFMKYCSNTLLTHGLFVTYYPDWYKGNVSVFPSGFQKNYVKGNSAGYNWRDYRDRPMAGYCYYKRTDGLRHPFREVFYITASTTYDDVMYTVNNPPSPMKSVLKKYLFRMISSSEQGIFRRTRKLVDLCDEYGMTNLYLLYHAPLFFRRHMGSEAFPGDMNVALHHAPEGGDEGLKKLFARMREVGMRPGYYDSYPARDVSSANFHYDWLKFRSDSQWDKGWRCAIQKPWAFAELASTMLKDRAEKFGARVGYQDGVTSWELSYMNDMDHRWPESGTLRETMRAYATGWQRTRENMDGPAFAEGRGGDYFIAGLNDGNYAKLKGYWDDKDCTEDRVRLFVDFRLKRLGPLCAPVSLNIGYAGFAANNKINYYRFYSSSKFEYFHHFLTAQIAFATIGMFEPYWCVWDNPKHQFDKSITSYFMMQQLQERYIMEQVAEVKYFDGRELLSTSDALRAEIVKDNRLYIRYENGLEVWLNMNWDGKTWAVKDRGKSYDLPPGGWVARHGDDFLEFSAMINGTRVDFVDSPAYVYLDGHGKVAEVNGYKTDRQWIKWKKGPKAGTEISFPKK